MVFGISGNAYRRVLTAAPGADIVNGLRITHENLYS